MGLFDEPEADQKLLDAGFRRADYAGLPAWRAPSGNIYAYAEDALAALASGQEKPAAEGQP